MGLLKKNNLINKKKIKCIKKMLYFYNLIWNYYLYSWTALRI